MLRLSVEEIVAAIRRTLLRKFHSRSYIEETWPMFFSRKKKFPSAGSWAKPHPLPGDKKWVCLGWKGCAMASLRPIHRLVSKM